MSSSYEEPSFDDTRTRRAWWSVALAAALAAGAWAWGNYGHLAQPAAARPTGTAFPWHRADRLNEPGGAAPVWLGAAAPRATDRSLHVDAQGHLLVTRSLRDLFDAVLGPPGTPPPADARARIAADLRAQLPPTALAQALALLDQYLAYNAALRGLVPTTRPATRPVAQSPDDRLSRLHVIEDLRARHFSAAEQQAFFGDDLAGERYAIAHDQLMQDPTLNIVDKAQRLSQLRAQLSPAWLAQLDPAGSALDVGRLTDQWRASKGTPQELRAMREALVGVQGADQLEAQDRQAQVWGKQLSSFGEQIKATLADPSLSDVQRQQALAELRKQNLAELERLGSLPPGSLKP